MHANAGAEVMGSFPVVVPPAPGLLCALGDVVAHFRNEFARTFIRTVDRVNVDEVLGILRDLAAEANRWLDREGIPPERRSIYYNVDMRYYRQGYEIPVEVDPAQLASDGVGLLVREFNRVHEQLYGFRMDEATCEVVNLRAIGLGEVPKPTLAEFDEDGPDPSRAVVDEHAVYFRGGWLPTRVYDRLKLAPGNRVRGPAVVVEFDSTTVVLPGYEATVDRYLNLIIRPATS